MPVASAGGVAGLRLERTSLSEYGDPSPSTLLPGLEHQDWVLHEGWQSVSSSPVDGYIHSFVPSVVVRRPNRLHHNSGRNLEVCAQKVGNPEFAVAQLDELHVLVDPGA